MPCADIKAANRKHHNEQLNRMTQNMLFSAVADANELAARKSLAILVELWRRHVWRDSRTISVIGEPFCSIWPIVCRPGRQQHD